MESFKPQTLQHAVCVGICFAIMVGTALVGRAWRGTDRGERLRVTLGWIGVVYWIGSNIWWNWPSHFALKDSLPIQICDLAGLFGPIGILLKNRPLRAVLYFWGFALSSQGFFFPVLTEGASYGRFWLFWANHTIIVGLAIYDVVALGFRPTWRDYFTVVGVSAGYLALIIPFDVIFGVNYGYVGDTVPENPTPIDKLGSWPLRIVPLVLIGLTAMVLILLPWEIARRLGRKRGGEGELAV